jgi:hypothetical protein
VGSQVQFQVNQVWTSSGISWISTYYTKPCGTIDCPKLSNVSPGAVNYGSTLTAKCTNNVATVTLYVHDGSFATTALQNSQIPSLCAASNDQGKKVSYTYNLPCICV